MVGAGSGRSIINARGLAYGIYIDGIDAPKPRLSNVSVTGFTIENAQFEGIYITNASFGLPGVAMHSHTPGQILNDNVIVGNQISGNGADTADAATPGPAGINVFGVSTVTGTVISGNSIQGEDDDIVTNTSGEVAIHFNNLLGGKLGVNNLGGGAVDATENWWGNGKGPGAWWRHIDRRKWDHL